MFAFSKGNSSANSLAKVLKAELASSSSTSENGSLSTPITLLALSGNFNFHGFYKIKRWKLKLPDKGDKVMGIDNDPFPEVDELEANSVLSTFTKELAEELPFRKANICTGFPDFGKDRKSVV